MENFDTTYSIGVAIPAWIHALGLTSFLLLIAWSLFWKGVALWHAGRRNQPWWFVIFLIVNTVGILEIIYLFAVLKLKFSELFTKK